MTKNLTAYLLAELPAAMKQHDGDATVARLRQLDTIAGREFTLRLTDQLITAGLRRAAQRPADLGGER